MDQLFEDQDIRQYIDSIQGWSNLDSLKYGVIYVIVNLLNNKTYVGQTKYPRKRWADHLSQNKTRIDKEINIVGEEYFVFVVVEIAKIENLNDRELYWINKTDSYNNGYNMKDY